MLKAGARGGAKQNGVGETEEGNNGGDGIEDDDEAEDRRKTERIEWGLTEEEHEALEGGWSKIKWRPLVSTEEGAGEGA